VIERPGQEQAFLASGGWQANYTHLKVSLRQDDTPRQGLRLSRDLLKFFESGYNYKISLFDLHDQDLGFFVIGWNPGQELLIQPSPEGLHPIPEPRREPEPEPEPAPRLGPEPLPEPELEPILVAAREVVQCRKCRGEIFSTFSACPYCGSSLVR
jgi:hypothetical protein